MEVASDASAWLVAITTTLLRVITFVSSQHRLEAKFERVGGVAIVRFRNATALMSLH